MYLDTFDDQENTLDMGSVVLAALHRWKRHEPYRRQRLCRQSVKRRREQGRSRQPPITGETETAATPRCPDHRSSPADREERSDAEIGGGSEPPITALERAPQRLAMRSDCQRSAEAPTQVVCPRPGCRTSCGASQTYGPASRPGVPAEYLTADGGGGDRGLEALRCATCGWCVAVRVGAAWLPLEALLRDTQRRGAGWHRVTSLADRAALYLLLVYIYGERERSATRREPALRPPPPGDSALLLFTEDGTAVGCATLKRRGQLLRERGGPERFQMDILDTVYVRESARRRGLALILLDRLSSGAARLGRQLGVTRPTAAMRRLLHAFLADRPWARRLLFEVTWTAGVHNRTNIWEQMLADSGGGAEGGEGAEGCDPPPSPLGEGSDPPPPLPLMPSHLDAAEGAGLQALG